MSEHDKADVPVSEAKARQLVEYARAQVEPALQAQLACKHRELPEDLFPGYTIVANASHGGQGRVYEAIDNSTGRRVAIKVLRSGPFGGDAERGRFEREIQILAQLQHPNIVTIHSSGTVALQRYFVMDFIEGQPLGKYLAGNHLSIEQTLAVFLRICEAVNTAHLLGIVHRDLKPSNIQIDDYGEPHVLDFGLAKAVSGSDGESPVSMDETVAGLFVGSLPWAAPEQVMNKPEAIDLRTDVYGLGLLLYFMLTQSFPYDRGANLRDVTDSILQSDPVPPSTLRREVDDELSTITLMCLQKEPARRYQIAGELARDIKRYLAGEPIDAKRDSARYLLTKTLRRHRGLAIMAGSFVIISLGYAVTMSFLYQSATESERLAEQRAADVSKHYAIAREAMGFLVDEVSNSLPQTRGVMRFKRDILAGAFARLLPLVEQHSDDPLLLEDMMRTHYQLGDIAIAMGRLEEAGRHLQEALDIRLRLSPRESQSPEELAELSIHYVLLGDVAQKTGDMEKCARFYAEALDIDEALVAAHPNNAHFLDNLAWSYNRLSCFAEERRNDIRTAKELCLKQLEIMERLTEAEPDDAIRLHGLSAALDRLIKLAQRVGDSAAMSRHSERRLAISNRMIAAAPDDPFLLAQHILAVTNHFTIATGRSPDERVEGLLGARVLVERLLDLEPDVPRSHYAQIMASIRLMLVTSGSGNQKMAIAAANEVIDGAEAYAELAPPDPEVVSQHAQALVFLLNLSESQGDTQRARDYHRRLCEVYERGIASNLKSRDMRISLLRLRLDNHDLTSVERQEIIAEAQRILQLIESHDIQPLMGLGSLFAKLEKHELAVELFERVQDHLSSLGVALPDDIVRSLEECRAALRE